MPERCDIIVGAGLAGLAAAHELTEAGETRWRVFEKEDRVGGHARSFHIGGYVFDLGPHILFTQDAEIETLIRDLLGDNLREQAREAFIYHAQFDLYTRFPFQAHLHGLPTEIVKACLVGLIRAVERQARGEFSPENYSDWMRGFFGDEIAERLMIPYARKLWTVEPDTMDFSWVAGRVTTPETERIIEGALTADAGSVGATASFWYPWHGGIESLARALAERVPNVELGREVERIDVRRRTLTLLDGERLAFNELILTLPLCDLPHWIVALPPRVERACQALRYQGILNINVGVDHPRVSDKHWIYFYEDRFPFHRVSFPGNFSSQSVPPGKSSISAEIAFPPRAALDEEALVARTLGALEEASLLPSRAHVELVHVQRIEPAYVIYGLDHHAQVDIVRSWLAENGVHLAGRFGEWQYFNMDHAIASGRRAARAILEQRIGGVTGARVPA